MKVNLGKTGLLSLLYLAITSFLAGLSPRAATLVWDPNPPEEGVTHYVVTIDSLLFHSEHVVTGTSFPLVGLEPGLLYTLSVRAVSPLGASAPSVVSFSLPTLPNISEHPQSVTVDVGSQIILNVTASGGSLNYRWFHDGEELSSQTSSSLVIPSASSLDEGTYFVRVSNTLGSVDSDPAVVTVETPSVNKPTIVSHPVSRTVPLNASFILTVSAAGTQPLAYQWFKNGALLSGQTSDTLTVSAATMEHEASYTVVVSNDGGSSTSNPAVINVIAPPVIIWHPESDNISIGASFQLTVAAESEEPPQFQWLKDGVEVSGATSSTYAVTSAEVRHTGTYRARVSNSAGSVLSNPAVITVPGTPRIIEQMSPTSVNEGAELRLAIQVTGTAPFTFEWFRDDSSVATTTEPELVIPATKLTDAGLYTVRVSGPFGDTISDPALVTVFPKPAITSHPQNVYANVGASVSLSVTASGEGLTYQWIKDGQEIPTATGSTLLIASLSESDYGSYIVRASNAAGSAESNPAIIGRIEPPVITTPPASMSVLVDSSLTLSVTATGSMPITYQWYKSGQLIPGETSSTLERIVATTADGGSYHVIVSNAGGSFRSGTATVTIVPHIVINQQPSPLNVVVGAPLSLSVAATSTLPLDYQWFRNDLPLTGRTSPTLQIPTTSFDDAGTYRVSIRNSVEEVSSETVEVNVGNDTSGGVLAITTTGAGAGGGLRITAVGLPNTTYEIQVTTNLQSWSTLQTVLSASDGAFVIQPPAGQGSFWFLRTVRR